MEIYVLDYFKTLSGRCYQKSPYHSHVTVLSTAKFGLHIELEDSLIILPTYLLFEQFKLDVRFVLLYFVYEN